jgi:uncharacterized membrane protein YphA (DoxX/SURF4 family)
MNVKKIIGWVLSVLLAAFLCFSASGKFSNWEGKEEMMAKMGWDLEVIKTIGIIEIVATVLFLIPRTAFIGAILLSAYLGGAVATHVRINDPAFFPVIIGVIVWIALGLRDGRVFTTAFTAPPKPLAD